MTFLRSTLGGASCDRVHDVPVNAILVFLGLFRGASTHMREIWDLSNEKKEKWISNISNCWLNLLVPPHQSVLYPFIIQVQLKHLYNVVIKHNVLKQPILQPPPFTLQHNTCLPNQRLSNDNWNTIRLIKMQVYAIVCALIFVRLCTCNLLAWPLLPSPGCITVLGPIKI